MRKHLDLTQERRMDSCVILGTVLREQTNFKWESTSSHLTSIVIEGATPQHGLIRAGTTTEMNYRPKHTVAG